MDAIYDTIGIDYAQLRRPDPRIARLIEEALGPAETVLNVGAGTGSYEPPGRKVTAVELSSEMIRQRKPDAAPAIQATADALPFADKSFDAAMASLTLHHWPDKEVGLREMRHVTRGPIVLLTFDPAHRPWLTDYLPGLAALDEPQMPPLSDYERWLGPVRILPVPCRTIAATASSMPGGAARLPIWMHASARDRRPSGRLAISPRSCRHWPPILRAAYGRAATPSF